ncbi:MAG: aminoacyl-tRNA hydrolase [Rhodospirillaceae bacterium]|jgi:PTH1 family peptidyl-tRNA hydrolase|nr:aminoacyl-tRNA hydrolase [Rhodospirillales bacterium]MBT3906884.1 aminoacyl-tRNA hydrolase [Rhodospirillaceae bacterium]MBT5033273.1 aminoacyl-tRNA hydrolase [Rhodospirillaceae bacterium]MBT6220967.1 aminoacyl-tRNA hydrolase [Rhodospirillaceae bacterium]MBT6362152.1 aminoacyl-tRNA hydrolase [Rhodospirillaceae bacterium]
MLLIVGLGNPGSQYSKNRHNIGFMAVDEIVRRHGFGAFRAKFQGELAEGKVGTQKVLALKPMTFMNESGRSVAQAVKFYKIAPEDVIVLHDELDLAAGKLRVKSGGGHGGHNGLRSIHAQIGPDYRRIRLGIGHPGDKSKVTGHVLKDFAKADGEWLEPELEAIADHFDTVINGKDANFMTEVARVMKPQTHKPAPDKKEDD